MSSPITDAMPAYRKTIRTLPILANLAEGHPKTESVLAVNPDFVYAPFAYFKASGIGTLEDYDKYGIPIYMENIQDPKILGSAAGSLQIRYDEIRNIEKYF